MEAALQGIKVVDFTVALSGPLCAQLLGDMGADVIKVERPAGEPTRRSEGPLGLDDLDRKDMGGEGFYDDRAIFLAVNRSKRSLAVDVNHPKGKEIVWSLVRDADVILENFRPGVMDRLGFGYDEVSKVNPRIVYSSQTGYGEQGPLARRIGGDMWAQAMSGIVALQGSRQGPPYMVGCMFVDQGTAAVSAFGVALALLVRERTGVGQRLTSNLLQTGMFLQSVEMGYYLTDGDLRVKLGRGLIDMVPGGAYKAKDGDVVSIFGVGPQWPAFCKVLGLEHLIDDPRFDTHEKRQENRDELYPLLDEAFSKRTRAEWQEIFRQAKMRVDPCLDYAELAAHPHVAANQMLIDLEHPVKGSIRGIAPPVRLARNPARLDMPQPLVGQHTREIMLSAGYSEADIEALDREGVIHVARMPQSR